MANRVKVSDMPSSAYIEDAVVLGKLIKAKRTKLNMKLALAMERYVLRIS